MVPRDFTTIPANSIRLTYSHRDYNNVSYRITRIIFTCEWNDEHLIKPQVFNSLYNLKPIRSSFLFMADIWIDTFSWNQIFLRHQKYRFVTVYYFFPRFLLVINRRRDYSELLTRLTTLRNSIPSDETTPFLDQTRGGRDYEIQTRIPVQVLMEDSRKSIPRVCTPLTGLRLSGGGGWTCAAW